MSNRMRRVVLLSFAVVCFTCFSATGVLAYACFTPLPRVELASQPIRDFLGTEHIDAGALIAAALATTEKAVQPTAKATVELIGLYYLCRERDCTLVKAGIETRAKRHAPCGLIGFDQSAAHELVVQFILDGGQMRVNNYPSPSSAPLIADWGAMLIPLEQVIEIAYTRQGNAHMAAMAGQPYTLSVTRMKTAWSIGFGDDPTFQRPAQVRIEIDAMTGN